MEPTEESPPFSVPLPPATSTSDASNNAIGSSVVAHDLIDAEIGQLTAAWSTVFWVGWLLIAGAFAAVWYSSRLIGLSTWWLGPATDPQLILVSLLPFTVPLALTTAGFTAQRWLPWWGIGGAFFVAGVAAFDINRVPGYAVIEFGLALAGLFISIACSAGIFRPADQARHTRAGR